MRDHDAAATGETARSVHLLYKRTRESFTALGSKRYRYGYICNLRYNTCIWKRRRDVSLLSCCAINLGTIAVSITVGVHQLIVCWYLVHQSARAPTEARKDIINLNGSRSGLWTLTLIRNRWYVCFVLRNLKVLNLIQSRSIIRASTVLLIQLCTLLGKRGFWL